MYRSITAQQYKEHLGFSQDYTVDGVLVYGTLYEERVVAQLKASLEEMGYDTEPLLLAHPFLRFAREVQIGDKKSG